MSHGIRPADDQAETAIESFLTEKLGVAPPFNKCEDGDDGWAFWINEHDTTSYLHHDLKVEWYGTSYDTDAEEDERP